MNAPRSKRVDVDGWLVLDKPQGLTSTHAVSRVKRLFNAKKAGHAGTLDPLATGILPIAFGEATKTVPFVQDGKKAYRFTVRWAKRPTATIPMERSRRRATHDLDRDAIVAALAQFTGAIMQIPPTFSAIKVGGERAYDIARDGETVQLKAREVIIDSLDLIAAGADEAEFEARCGKGTYVRAIARDMGRALGCFGHVTALRRTQVGPFRIEDAVPLAALEGDPAHARDALLSVEAGTGGIALCCGRPQRRGATSARATSHLARARRPPRWHCLCRLRRRTDRLRAGGGG